MHSTKSDPTGRKILKQNQQKQGNSNQNSSFFDFFYETLLESESMCFWILGLAEKKTKILSSVRAILWVNFQVARSSRTKKIL